MTEARFHIDKNGNPGVCKATKKACPLGGEHYDNVEDAMKVSMLTKAENTEDGKAEPATAEIYTATAVQQAVDNFTRLSPVDFSTQTPADQMVLVSFTGVALDFYKDKGRLDPEHEAHIIAAVEDFKQHREPARLLVDLNRSGDGLMEDSVSDAIADGAKMFERHQIKKMMDS